MKTTLICTLGTSLFKPNLFSLPNSEAYQDWLLKQPKSDQGFFVQEKVESLRNKFQNILKEDLVKQSWDEIAKQLLEFPSNARICGAEINSIADLIERQYCIDRCNLILCHSATTEGLQIAKILEKYYRGKNFNCVELEEIEDLQDQDPKRFKTKGLRNLAKTISRVIRNYGSVNCAINATGGYKAQIAIGVLMGQALGVAVYYKHEKFSEIIEFPPMPIGLDFSFWLEKSGWLTALDRGEIIAVKDAEPDWDERMEALVEKIDIGGKLYFELSPTGQIFHETFKGRFSSDKDRILPPEVSPSDKEDPRLPRHGWGNAEPKILAFLQKIINECSYVSACRTDYWNPDLSVATLFHAHPRQQQGIEGIYSNGTWTVKFLVETSSSTIGQRDACIADLNHRLEIWL